MSGVAISVTIVLLLAGCCCFLCDAPCTVFFFVFFKERKRDTVPRPPRRALRFLLCEDTRVFFPPRCGSIKKYD